MDDDHQAIERRDFPISRRGYDPAAVDAHLRQVAGELARLRRELAEVGAGAPLAASASTQVQSVIAAAEAAAATIEREAVAKARSEVAAVAAAASALLERISAIDVELEALADSVQGIGPAEAAGPVKRSSHLPAAGEGGAAADAAGEDGAAEGRSKGPAGADGGADAGAHAGAHAGAGGGADAGTQEGASTAPVARAREAGKHDNGAGTSLASSGDLDGARLVALNMALAGETREATDRYLAEHFGGVAERAQLIDAVYAAIAR